MSTILSLSDVNKVMRPIIAPIVKLLFVSGPGIAALGMAHSLEGGYNFSKHCNKNHLMTY